VDTCPAGSALTDTITIEGEGTIFLADPLFIQTGGPLMIDGGETITLSGKEQVRIFSNLQRGRTGPCEISPWWMDLLGSTGGVYNDGSLRSRTAPYPEIMRKKERRHL
jgi:hypothetical protein